LKYAAFLRGINVGGKNIIKMAELKQLFEALSFQNVRTYLQSGNVVFETDKKENTLVAEITKGFSAAFGFESEVILRSSAEIADMIKQLPFSNEEIAAAQALNPDIEHLYVFMLEHVPPETEIAKLCETYSGNDKLYTAKRELYLLCSGSIRDSKLAASLGKLSVTSTVRNWKTINKIDRLMRSN
jgi:uncharacterized protein (DUF1697 family)